MSDPIQMSAIETVVDLVSVTADLLTTRAERDEANAMRAALRSLVDELEIDCARAVERAEKETTSADFWYADAAIRIIERDAVQARLDALIEAVEYVVGESIEPFILKVLGEALAAARKDGV